MSKYAPLTDHLAARRQSIVEMTFPELESVLGFPLPASARKFREWWSNNPRNHTQALAWLDAGYRSRDVDFAAERLVFEKLNRVDASPAPSGDHPLWGCLAGTITLAPGFDPTEPMFSEAELAEWDASLDRKARLIAGGKP